MHIYWSSLGVLLGFPLLVGFKNHSKFHSVRSSSKMTSKSVTKVDGIESWNTYFSLNKESLKSLLQKHDSDFKLPQFEVNPSLNEKVSLWRGNITTLGIDAIVNAANSRLLGGGGVDGAIHSAAGPQLKEECKTLNGCATGDAKITAGYELPAKHIIHTVGPQGEIKNKLESCYNRSLTILVENKLKTIAFPCISTGIYGYPQDAAALVAIRTARSFLEANSDKVDRIIFCLFLPEDVKIYQILMQKIFPVESI